MLNDTQLDTALTASPAPRVTKEYMESRITDKTFTRFSDTVTLCQITLDNGYSVRGESACVNPANYNQEIGERIAFDNAFVKLWPLSARDLVNRGFRGNDQPWLDMAFENLFVSKIYSEFNRIMAA